MVLPRAFDLLDALTSGKSSLTLTEAAQLLDVPRSSLSTILKTMTDLGVLSRSGKSYSVGPRAYGLASKIQAGRTIRQVARPYMEKAQEVTGETIILSELAEDNRYVYYIDVIESDKPVRFSVPVAARRPLYATASGRLFLASFSEKTRNAYYNEAVMERLARDTVTDRFEMEQIVSEIQRDKFATAIGQISDDAAGFAAPLLDESGDIVAAITIGVPLPRGKENAERYIAAAVDAGTAISKVLGYSGR